MSETINTAVLFNESLDSGAAVDFHARRRYIDRWSRRNGRWAIDHRHLPAADITWKQSRTAGHLGSRCRHNASDPSYAIFGTLADQSTDKMYLVAADRDIRRQLAIHCRAEDRHDVNLLLSVWHTDGIYRDVDAGIEGRITDLADTLTGQTRTGRVESVHLANNATIAMCGDDAVSGTYTTNLVRSRRNSGEPLVDIHSRGSSLDRWSFRDGRWALEYRENLTDFSWQQPVGIVTGSREGESLEDPFYMHFALSRKP